jgi:glutamyl-tRNA synthetase
LYDFFAWQPPEFAHVPLVVGPDGRRLAKRHGDTRLATLRDRGVRAEELLGLLAWSAGLQDTSAPVSARELVSEFTLARLPRSPWVFDEALLRGR